MPKVTNHTVGGDRGTSKPALGESWKSVPHVRLQLSRDAGSNVCQASILKHSFMVYSFMHMHHWAHLQSVLFTFYLTQEAACPRFLTSLSKKENFILLECIESIIWHFEWPSTGPRCWVESGSRGTHHGGGNSLKT